MAGPKAIRTGIRAAIGLAVLGAWVTMVGGALAANSAVTIKDFTFGPASLGVVNGDTVTWTNDDAAGHTATAVGGAFDTGRIAPGALASFTFPTAGTYAYTCTIHPAMKGTIIVLDAVEAITPPVTDATAPAADGVPTAGGSGPTAALLGLLALAGALGTILARRRLAAVRD